MHARLTLLTLTMIFAGACGDDKNQSTSGASETDSGSSTGGASDPTDATNPTDATDGTIGMSSEPTTDAVTGGMTSTTTGVMMTTDGETMVLTTDPVETTTDTEETTTEPEETTGGVDPEIMEACAKVCELMIECMLMPDLETCTAECADGSAGDEPMCQKAKQEVLVCASEMSCEELGALVNDSDPGPCLEPIIDQMGACDEGGGECSVGVGANMEGTECDFTLNCTGEPLRAMQCNTKNCACLEGGMKVGMCQADNVCMNPEDIQTKALECCGF